MNGLAKNAASGVFSQAALNAKGAFFQVAANNVGEMVGEEPQAAALRQTDELGLAIGVVGLPLTGGRRPRGEEISQPILRLGIRN